MWESFRNIALIGTEKKPLEASLLPSSIQEALKDTDQTPEEHLLQAAAYLTYYQEAGALPPYEKVEDKAAIEETLAEAPELPMRVFQAIKNAGAQLSDYLLGDWLDWLISKQWKIAGSESVNLVNLTQIMRLELREKAVKVLGNKGRWMLSHHPKKELFLDFEKSDIWEEGTTAQRKNFWAELHASDPETAIQLLKNTWDAEAIITKKGFLEVMNSNLSRLDQDFLTHIYNNEFAYKAKEKKTEKECRALVAAMLLRIPESDLYKFTAQKLSTYIKTSKKSALLGLISSDNIAISVPDENHPDDFWNDESMLINYGFDHQYDIEWFNDKHQYYLSSFLEVIPLSFWAHQFTKGTAAFVDYILGKDFQMNARKKVHAMHQAALIKNVSLNHDSALAEYLINKLPADQNVSLLSYVSQDAFETYVKEKKLWTSHNILEQTPGRTWSLPFSNYVLKGLFESYGQQYHSMHYHGQALCKYLHIDSGDELRRLNEKAQSVTYYKSWEKNVFTPAKLGLTLKKAIASSNE
ncbi:DUF5691 domain-containing protein [Fulvivirga sediminis]|uniref:Uncharacterized protein n=1 Tax=Fulvivirga sediminis TaxID=2803949 RepID=A0A937F8E1_9BACT|nr:DUF5691 domain-containing protein [Fulvivirga sediminis]MBL3656917.1 hypothetical protein [Fulvivirga sediminis]